MVMDARKGLERVNDASMLHITNVGVYKCVFCMGLDEMLICLCVGGLLKGGPV